MQNVPKIVSERLRVAAARTDHPDADVLAAFSERALSDRERVVVLEHLALCGDCRDLIMLTLPAMEENQPVLGPVRGSWFTWPTLRWGFAAIGIIVVASFGILEYEQHAREHTTIAMFAPQVESSDSQREAKGKANEGVPASQEKQESRPATGSGEAKTHSVQIAHANALAQRQQQRPSLSARRSLSGTASAARNQRSLPAGNVPSASETVTVEVTGATPSIETNQAQTARVGPAQTQPAQSGQTVTLAGNQLPEPQEENLNARDEQSDSVIKAKQAITAVATSGPPHWAISPAGVLQRSFDQGKTWQNVDVTASPASTGLKSYASSESEAVSRAKEKESAADKKALTASVASPVFRALAVNGRDVWVGGSNAVLYHSLDGGDHWSQIVPTSSGTYLSGDVIILEFANTGQGRIQTSTGETWMTTDNGQTWQKL